MLKGTYIGGTNDSYIGQTEANTPPSKKDYRETKRILADFRISCKEIPQMETKLQLIRWRTSKILQNLA